ncbi:hypothetical protein [Thermococcus sp.]
MMRMEGYYDTIPNFHYWDVEAWKDYLKKYVVPIYETTATLLELRDELSPYVGKSLKAVKDNDERLLPSLLVELIRTEITGREALQN